MGQSQSESDYDYPTRFTKILQNIEISGGEHIIRSWHLLGKYLTSATSGEITVEVDRLKAISFIHVSDENWYGELLEDLKKGIYKGRDEYQKTLTGAYAILVCTSHQIGPYTCQSGWFNHHVRGGGRSNFMFLQNLGRGDRGVYRDYRKTSLVHKLCQEEM